jgi:hypothetical protein
MAGASKSCANRKKTFGMIFAIANRVPKNNFFLDYFFRFAFADM